MSMDYYEATWKNGEMYADLEISEEQITPDEKKINHALDTIRDPE